MALEPDRVEDGRIARLRCNGRKESRGINDLLRLAHSRVLPGPVMMRDGRRSLAREVIEECADGVNYAPWAARAGQMSEDRAARICWHLQEAYRLAAGAE